MTATQQPARRNRRPKKRELFCPAHPEQLIQGNGRKCYLNLLQREQLQERGINAKKAQLMIKAYPMLVLSNQCVLDLFRPVCGSFLVTCDQTRPSDAYGEQSSPVAVVASSPCGAKLRQANREREHPPKR